MTIKLPIPAIILAPLSIFCLCTCVWIEILNYKAGGILPRDLSEEGEEGSTKWRVTSPAVRAFGYEHSYRSKHDLPPDAELPSNVVEEIKARVQAVAPRLNAEMTLRNVVGSIGLLQYPASLLLAMCGTIGGLQSRRKSSRMLLLAMGGVGLFCLGIAVFRAYFSSSWC